MMKRNERHTVVHGVGLLLMLALMLFSATCGSASNRPVTDSPELPSREDAGMPRTDRSLVNESYRKVLEYVDERGLVRYGDLKAHRLVLDRFVSELQVLDPSTYANWPSSSQLSFWINAYNGLTLLAIVNHYPIQPTFLASLQFPDNSIRQIPGVWDELQFRVMDRPLTLDGIEHGIIRKEFDEPRIHMALVCAAMGCPPLRTEPYAGDRLDSQLDDQTRRFLSSPSKFRIDRKRDVVSLSPIFDWYGSDFVRRYEPTSGFDDQGTVRSAVLNFIGDYLNPKSRNYLEHGTYRVSYLDYDWSLNEPRKGGNQGDR